MTYRPNPDSLAGLVLGFLARNPREELTFDEIVAKFVQPGDTRNVHTQLLAALDHAMLTYDPDNEVYSKGPIDLPLAATVDNEDEAAEVATCPPAGGFWPGLATSASGAMNSAADEPVTPRHVASPFDVLKRIPSRTKLTQESSDEMDGTGKGHAARVAADQDAEGDRGPAGPTDALAAGPDAPARPEEAGATAPVGRRGQGLAARALAVPRVAGHGEDAEPAGAGREGDGGQARGLHHDDTAPPATGDRAADLRPDVPQGEHGQARPGELEVGAQSGRVPGGQGALPAAGAGGDGDSGSGQVADASPIGTVRHHLLATLADLRNKEAPMAVDRARAIADVARELVNTAKVEVEYLKVTQQRRGSFFEQARTLPAPGGDA